MLFRAEGGRDFTAAGRAQFRQAAPSRNRRHQRGVIVPAFFPNSRSFLVILLRCSRFGGLLQGIHRLPNCPSHFADYRPSFHALASGLPLGRLGRANSWL